MATIQIKNVPYETHAVLRQRASRAGQSLQEYLRAKLIDQALQPTMAEWLDEVATRTPVKVTPADVIEAIHAERDERERQW